MIRGLRIAIVTTMLLGPLIHVLLPRIVGIEEWGTLFGDLAKPYSQSKCVPCVALVQFGLVFSWFAVPFYIVGLGLMFRSLSGLVLTLVLMIGLIGFDAWWYTTSSSKGWYGGLAPIALVPLAAIGLLVVWFVVSMTGPPVYKSQDLTAARDNANGNAL